MTPTTRLLNVLSVLLAPLRSAFYQEFGDGSTAPVVAPPAPQAQPEPIVTPDLTPAVETQPEPMTARDRVLAERGETLYVRKPGKKASYRPAANVDEPGTRYRKLTKGKTVRYEPVARFTTK